MEEIWKDIKGYEGLYQVSSFGRVKSFLCSRVKILKPGESNGYAVVGLRKFNKSKTFLVHKLVAVAFLNHEPCGHRLVVDHIDDNKLNNRVENLQITTQRFNAYKTQAKYTSKYKGVYWNKSACKWMSSIYIGGKRKYLGLFTDEHEAHLAYQKKLLEVTE